jgi:hypothetical protein
VYVCMCIIIIIIQSQLSKEMSSSSFDICSRMIECRETILKTKYSQFRMPEYARYASYDSQLEKSRVHFLSTMNYVFHNRSDKVKQDAAVTYAHYQKLEKRQFESKIGTDYKDAEGGKLAAEEVIFEEMKDGFVKGIVSDLETIAASRRFRVKLNKKEYEACYDKEMDAVNARIVKKRQEVDMAEKVLEDAKRLRYRVESEMKDIEGDKAKLMEEARTIAFLAEMTVVATAT